MTQEQLHAKGYDGLYWSHGSEACGCAGERPCGQDAPGCRPAVLLGDGFYWPAIRRNGKVRTVKSGDSR